MTVSNTDGGYDATHKLSAQQRHTSPPQPLAFPLPFAMHQLLLHGLPLEEQAAIVQTWGWPALGLLRLSLWRHGEERVNDVLLEAGLSAASLSWTGGFTGTTGLTFREAVADGRLAIREAAALGAKVLVVAPGARGGHTLRHALRVTGEGLKYLADEAADRGVRLAVLMDPLSRRSGATCVNELQAAEQLQVQVNASVLGWACPLHRWEEFSDGGSAWNAVAGRLWVAWCPLPPDEQRGAAQWRMRMQLGLEFLWRNGFRGQWEFWPETPADRHALPVDHWPRMTESVAAVRESLSKFAAVESGRRTSGW